MAVQVALLTDLYLAVGTLVRVFTSMDCKVFFEQQHAAVKNLVTKPLVDFIVELALNQKLMSLFTLRPDVDDSEHLTLFVVKLVIITADLKLVSFDDGSLATMVNAKFVE